jgi:hypothetical protein
MNKSQKHVATKNPQPINNQSTTNPQTKNNGLKGQGFHRLCTTINITIIT